jgi:hypothetical protein
MSERVMGTVTTWFTDLDYGFAKRDGGQLATEARA